MKKYNYDELINYFIEVLPDDKHGIEVLKEKVKEIDTESYAVLEEDRLLGMTENMLSKPVIESEFEWYFSSYHGINTKFMHIWASKESMDKKYPNKHHSRWKKLIVYNYDDAKVLYTINDKEYPDGKNLFKMFKDSNKTPEKFFYDIRGKLACIKFGF